ncbi:MAG: MobF family relaxase, partial [Gammaproteobacteria bacterium]
MLSLTVYRPNSSASSVEDYLRVGVLGEDANALEDYYLEDGQADAAFVGALLPRLGVGEDYNSEDFNRLFHGEDAQGKPLTPRRTSPKKPQKEASPTRRPGWDLTFSAPKSVSVAWGVASPELQRAIEQAQDQAVKTAFSYLERHFNTVSVGRGVRNEDGTFTVQTEKAKLAAATFRHGSSREQDPDLHSHLVLFNLAERADGKLLSVNGADFYARKKELGAIYRVALAHGLKELGFRIERDRFAFAIFGITPEAQQHFSQRRQQIEKALAVTRYQSAKAAEQAALATREGKQDLPPELLKAQWQSRAQAYGLSAEGIEALRVGAEKNPENTPDPLALESLLQNITEFESAVKDSKVREIIATQAQGLLDVTQT